MNITKLKLNDLIILTIIGYMIHHLTENKNIEGLTNNNKVKLKKCIRRVINRECTHPVKALRLKKDCEYGEKDEYLGIDCGNLNLIDRIICSHLIERGACKCQFGRDIIARSCSRKGVDKKCTLKMRNDYGLLKIIIDVKRKLAEIQENVGKKETKYLEDSKDLEEQVKELTEKKNDVSQKFENQTEKIESIAKKIKILIKAIEVQSEKLAMCDTELTEEKKAELDKLKEKLQGGLLNFRKRLQEEKRRGFTKERMIGIIQKQKELQQQNFEELKKKSLKEEIEKANIGDKLKFYFSKDYIMENKFQIGGAFAFIAVGVGVFVFLRMRKAKNIQMTQNQ